MRSIIGLAVAALVLSGCMSLPGGGTGVDPKFLDGVKEILTDTHCGHHDEFRATVGAAGIPASTTIIAVRDCPPPLPSVPVTPPAP